jgi:hypothetical protein
MARASAGSLYRTSPAVIVSVQRGYASPTIYYSTTRVVLSSPFDCRRLVCYGVGRAGRPEPAAVSCAEGAYAQLSPLAQAPRGWVKPLGDATYLEVGNPERPCPTLLYENKGLSLGGQADPPESPGGCTQRHSAFKRSAAGRCSAMADRTEQIPAPGIATGGRRPQGGVGVGSGPPGCPPRELPSEGCCGMARPAFVAPWPAQPQRSPPKAPSVGPSLTTPAPPSTKTFVGPTAP